MAENVVIDKGKVSVQKFQDELKDRVSSYSVDKEWQELSSSWLTHAFRQKYMYNFSALGRPIIQTPADIVAIQELIWSVKPDLVIETGIAHGGSLILSASMLALLDLCDAISSGQQLDPAVSARAVIGVDIDIREHNKSAIESHPLSSRIRMIEGSSVDEYTLEKVKSIAVRYSKVLVMLDSNHTHEHVLQELECYAPLASVGSYCVVFDTIVEDLPVDMFPNRPWRPGNSPKTAVFEFIKDNPHFEIDSNFEQKLMLSAAPNGYLRRIKD